MANELQVSLAFTYARGNFAQLARALTAFQLNVSEDPLVENVMTVTTSPVAVPVGNVTVGGTWAWFRNLDPTNYLQILTGTGGVAFCQLQPGEAALLRLGSGVTAPYAQANTASVSLEYCLFSL